MVTVIEVTAGRAGRREYLVEDLAIDRAARSRDVETDAQAGIPNLPLQGEDDELAIVAVRNRFHMSALLGAIDRRSTC